MNPLRDNPEPTDLGMNAPTESPPPGVRSGGFAYLDLGLVVVGLLVFGIAMLPDALGSRLLTTISFLVAATLLTGLAVYAVTQFLLATDRRSARVSPPQGVTEVATVVRMDDTTATMDAAPDPETLPLDTPSPTNEGPAAGVPATENPRDETGATVLPQRHGPEHSDSGTQGDDRVRQADQRIDAWLRQSRGRFELEIQKLAGRGRFNLALGVVIGGIGLALLANFVLDLGDQFQATEEYRRTVANPEAGRRLTGEWQNNAILQAMRLSLSLFFGAFAFFFLRLYRSSLDLIKYYQNELTNVEGRFAALLVALKVNDSGIMNVVVDHLSRTERNFVLKQGETTVELELARHDGEKMRDILRLVGGSPLSRRLRNAGRTNGGQG